MKTSVYLYIYLFETRPSILTMKTRERTIIYVDVEEEEEEKEVDDLPALGKRKRALKDDRHEWVLEMSVVLEMSSETLRSSTKSGTDSFKDAGGGSVRLLTSQTVYNRFDLDHEDDPHTISPF